jgi:hypothetical protein
VQTLVRVGANMTGPHYAAVGDVTASVIWVVRKIAQ